LLSSRGFFIRKIRGDLNEHQAQNAEIATSPRHVGEIRNDNYEKNGGGNKAKNKTLEFYGKY